MGLYINHLETVTLSEERSLYIYLLDYGWPDGRWEQIFKRHFMKMANLASDAGAVVIASPRGVHFGNEVLNWHRVGSLDADKVLPGLLITRTHPSYFVESGSDIAPAKLGLEDLLVIPLREFCSDEDEFVRIVEQVFDDLKNGAELRDFAVAKHDAFRPSRTHVFRRIGDAIELKPGGYGVSVDLKKLLFSK